MSLIQFELSFVGVTDEEKSKWPKIIYFDAVPPVNSELILHTDSGEENCLYVRRTYWNVKDTTITLVVGNRPKGG